MEQGSKMGDKRRRTTSCATRSRTAGIPRGRNSVSFLGMSTRLSGEMKEPDLRSRINAWRLSSRLASNILRLTLSIPAAPRLRLTALKLASINPSVIRPVREWALMILDMRSLQ